MDNRTHHVGAPGTGVTTAQRGSAAARRVRTVLGRCAGIAVTAALLAASLTVGATSASADALEDGQWWRKAMGVDELHRSGGTGKGVNVAVIDGPIDASVPELRGRIVSSTTQCLARGGDVYASRMKGVAADHATSMASVIVGSGKGTASGGRGIAGIAPQATLRHYAVTYPSASDSKRLTCGLRYEDLDESSQALAQAIRQAVKDGAKVLSISLSLSHSDELTSALLDAFRAGAIVVASTNNETRSVFWPGIGNGVVTVTHVDAKGNLDDSAMRKSSFVDFTAPGHKVAAGAWTSSGWHSDRVADGSSVATAITAGGLAAVWSAHPDATGNQVLQAAKDAIGLRAEKGKYITWFRRVGTNLPKATGKTESYGFGIFAPADAIKLDVESLPDVNPLVSPRSFAEPTAEQIAAATGKPASVYASPSPSPSRSSSPSGSLSPTPAPSGSATSASGTSTQASGGTPGQVQGDSEQSALPWVGAGVLGLVGAGAVIWLVRRRSTPGSAAPVGDGDPMTDA